MGVLTHPTIEASKGRQDRMERNYTVIVSISLRHTQYLDKPYYLIDGTTLPSRQPGLTTKWTIELLIIVVVAMLLPDKFFILVVFLRSS